MMNLKELAAQYPNDQELGAQVRKSKGDASHGARMIIDTFANDQDLGAYIREQANKTN